MALIIIIIILISAGLGTYSSNSVTLPGASCTRVDGKETETRSDGNMLTFFFPLKLSSARPTSYPMSLLSLPLTVCEQACESGD